MDEELESKRYWMKLYSRFFDKHEIKILLDEDRDYVFFYLAMLLESVAHKGYVRYNEKKAYTPSKLSRLLNMPEEKVLQSIEALKDADLLEMLEDGTIFLPKAQAMCGYTKPSTERVKKFRSSKRNSSETTGNTNETQRNTIATQCNTVETGSTEYRVQSTENRECVSTYNAHTREDDVISVPDPSAKKPPTWDVVKGVISSASVSVKIPESFARTWYDECEFNGWVDVNKRSISSCWRNKLLYAWRDAEKEQRKRNGGKTDAEIAREVAAQEAWNRKRLTEENDD